MNPNSSLHHGKRYPIYHPIKAKLPNEQNDLEYERYGHNESNKSVVCERTFDSLPSSSQLQSDDCFSHIQPSSNFYETNFPSALKPSRRQNPVSLEDALKSEKGFLDYVMSLPNRESMYSYSDDYADAQLNSLTVHDISKASNICGKNKLGFEHLDNLCKLMQQLGELREANVKLQRKVQYLEEVKPNHESNLLLSSDSHNQYNSSLELSDRTGSYLTIAHVSKDESDDCEHLIGINVPKSPCFSKDRKSRMLKSKGHSQMSKGVIVRERSKSVGYEEQLKSCDNIVTTSGHCELRESSVKPSKRIPTWSKVKEALGFEKHHSSQLGSNSQVSLTNTNPDRASDINKIGFKKISKSISKNQVQSAYQFDNNPNQVNDQILKNRSFSSGFEGYLNEESPCYDDNDYSRYDDMEMCLGYESEKNGKRLAQGPWNKVKNMIQTSKDNMRKKEKEKKQFKQVKSSLKFSHNHFKQTSIGGYEGIDDDDSNNSNQANEWINAQTSSPYSLTQSRSFQFGSKVDPYTRTDHLPRANILDIYEALTLKNGSSKPIINTASCSKFSKIKERQDSLNLRMSTISPPVQRRSKWVKMKKVFANAGEGARPLEMVFKTDDLSSISSSDASNKDEALIETPSDKVRKLSNESSFCQTPAINSNCSNEPVVDKIQELQRNLSEDFNKKMAEWEKMRSLGFEKENENNHKKDRKSSLPKLSKKRKTQRSMDKISKIKMKDVNWLERELSKIDKEKERLSKEHEKYEEKAQRLIKLKEAITQPEKTNTKKEILIRTSAGEFRFEGISDDFTRKLYEWETKKGVCPESSTIALLNSSRRYSDLTRSEVDNIKNGNKNGLELFTRSISRSESNLSNLLNHRTLTRSRLFASLPSLKPNDVVNYQNLNNSDNLDLLKYISKDQLERKKSLVNEIEIKSGADTPYLLNESNIDAIKSKNVNSQYEKAENSNQEDNYYKLLESNALLFENLQNKESLCNRLKNELKALDDKLKEMKDNHQIEMEHYRDKLWKLHITGNKQVYLESSLKIINELKDRINQVQTCGERLKLDKEYLEQNFRYHNDQQAKMTLELIEGTKNLEQVNFLASSSSNNVKDEARSNQKPLEKCNQKSINILHDLSSQIFQQACEIERALLDCSRIIGKLQWELLNRDISIIKLQTELEGVKSEQNKLHFSKKAATRRYKYGQKRSESEKLHLKQFLHNNEEDDDNQEAIHSLLTFKDLAQTIYNKSELSKITHKLKMELLKLSHQCDQKEEKSEQTQESQPLRTNDVKTFQNLVNVQPKIYQNSKNHSVDNVSSGPEGSQNSSLNNCDQIFYKPQKCWRQTRNASQSSESSSIEEERLPSSQWSTGYTNFKLKSPNLSLHDNQSNNVASQFTSGSGSSSDISSRQEKDSLNQLYNNSIFLKYSTTSFPVLNKEFEEFSSTLGHHFDSSTNSTNLNQSNFQSFCSSEHDKYAGIPMIDEDQLSMTSSNQKTRSDINNHRLLVYMASSTKPWTVEKMKQDYNKMENVCNTASKDVKPLTKETFQKPS